MPVGYSNSRSKAWVILIECAGEATLTLGEKFHRGTRLELDFGRQAGKGCREGKMASVSVRLKVSFENQV